MFLKIKIGLFTEKMKRFFDNYKKKKNSIRALVQSFKLADSQFDDVIEG